jgi:hypothetical protein
MSIFEASRAYMVEAIRISLIVLGPEHIKTVKNMSRLAYIDISMNEMLSSKSSMIKILVKS